MAMCVLQHSTLNSVIEQELRDRRVEDRANATSLLSGDSVLVNPSIQKVRTKCKKASVFTLERKKSSKGPVIMFFVYKLFGLPIGIY